MSGLCYVLDVDDRRKHAYTRYPLELFRMCMCICFVRRPMARESGVALRSSHVPKSHH